MGYEKIILVTNDKDSILNDLTELGYVAKDVTDISSQYNIAKKIFDFIESKDTMEFLNPEFIISDISNMISEFGEFKYSQGRVLEHKEINKLKKSFSTVLNQLQIRSDDQSFSTNTTEIIISIYKILKSNDLLKYFDESDFINEFTRSEISEKDFG